MERTPEEDGFRSFIIIKEADLRCMIDLITWLRETWLPENGYDGETAIVRNAPGAALELMAKHED